MMKQPSAPNPLTPSHSLDPVNGRPGRNSTARPPSGSKSTRSTRSRMGLLSARILAVAGPLSRPQSQYRLVNETQSHVRSFHILPGLIEDNDRGLQSEHVLTSPNAFTDSHMSNTCGPGRRNGLSPAGIFDAVVYGEDS